MRSLLFVPTDNERKLAKAVGCGADALVFDLEDSVLPERKPTARAMLAEYLRSWRGPGAAWIRVNDLASGELLKDLAAVVALAPAGIVLPKIRGPEDLDAADRYLEMAEAMNGLVLGGIGIIAVCTETPSAVLRMSELLKIRRPRLKGMTWGGEDLSAALGAGDPRTADGAWRPLYEYARSQCLLACHALEIAPIDTAFLDFRNPDACRANTELARHDGFTGKVAIHPDQVPVINAAFTPSQAEIEFARRVVAAFAAGAGAVSLDGKMLDIPHLKSARRILELTQTSPQ